MIVILSVAKAGTQHSITHNGKNVELLYKHISVYAVCASEEKKKNNENKQLVNVHRRSKHEFYV